MCVYKFERDLGNFFFFFTICRVLHIAFAQLLLHTLFLSICVVFVYTRVLYTFASKDLMKFENVQGDLEDDDELIFNFDLISEQLNLKKLKVFICYKSVFIFTRFRRIALVN